MISLSSAQRGISSLFRAILRSLSAALSIISAQLQQFIDEEPTFPAAMATIQGTTVVGSVAAAATVAANQLSMLSIPVPQIETASQPEPTLPIFHDMHTEDQFVADHGAGDVPPEEE